MSTIIVWGDLFSTVVPKIHKMNQGGRSSQRHATKEQDVPIDFGDNY